VRHLVGGRSAEVRDERLYRFELPERPGALRELLDQLGGRWNISLFHYRNHGADFGRVLAGFEVPPGDAAAFQEFLNGVGCRSVAEAENPAYALFLEADRTAVDSAPRIAV
jgi:threonine dehydratase